MKTTLSVLLFLLGASVAFAEPFFTEDFEGASKFTLVNGTQTNQWVIGGATTNGGTKSVYISNDNGTSNTYNTSNTSVTHLYADIEFPDIVESESSYSKLSLSFDWKGQGENNYDDLKVYIVNPSTKPVAGTPLNATFLVGTYNGYSVWQRVSIAIPDSYSGSTQRIVFSWRNDNATGTQPPAAIDNIDVSATLVTLAQEPAELFFTEDFEGAPKFTMVNSGQTNQWVVGTATANGGTKSAYISGDGGTTYGYEAWYASSVVHLYADITFPELTGSDDGYNLSFDWKGEGDGYNDFLKVYVVETSTFPDAGLQLTNTLLGTYTGEIHWQKAYITLPASYSGTTKRLVFSWRNDASSGSGSTPIAIDNVEVGVWSDFKIASIANRSWTGGLITPEPVVTRDGRTLVKGTHYTVSYSDNTNVGTATVTIIGAGGYEGRVGNHTANFNILRVACSASLFAGGAGTEENPYKISTPVQLAALQNCLGSGTPDNNQNKYYTLTQDIDLTSYLSESGADYSAGQGWLPIGDNNTNTHFYGHFDGARHNVTGLWINRPTRSYVGLFGYISGASVQNIGVNIDNAKGGVKGQQNVGGLIAYNYNSTVSNSYVVGAVKGDREVGGLVGFNGYSGTIANSYTIVQMTGNAWVGGLVGYNSSSGTIINTYVAGTVTDSLYFGDIYVGGIGLEGLIGDNDGTVSNSYYDSQTTGRTGGTGKTTAEMREQATFVGFNFVGTWKIDEGLSYPYFAWQPTISNPDLVTVSLPGNASYTGLVHTPEPTVEYDGTLLVKGKDYILLYDNNTDAGTASVTVQGTGKYGGAVQKIFTIAKVPLAIASVSANGKTYDGTNTATVSAVEFSGLVNGETLAQGTDYTVSAEFASTNMGIGKTVTVTVTLIGAKGNNYSLALNTQNTTATIEKAPLTVTANDKNKTYGQANPVLSVSYDGFVNNETASDLATAPTASTLATTTSAVDEYEITVSGGVSGNYEFSYVSGILTIGKATPVPVAPTGLSAIYGQTLASVSLPSSWAWKDVLTTPVGNANQTGNSFAAIFTPENTNNYTTAEVNLSIVVAKAVLIVPTNLTATATKGQTLSQAVKGVWNINGISGIWTWVSGDDSVGELGEHTVYATFTHTNPNYEQLASNMAVKLTVSVAPKLSQTIAFQLPETWNIRTGAAILLDVSASSGLPVSFTIYPASAAEIDNGVLILHQTGTLSITAMQIGNEFYVAATPVAKTIEITDGNTPIISGTPPIPQYTVRAVNKSIAVDGLYNAITVYDTQGRIVVEAGSARSYNSGVTIPVPVSGLYFVKIQNGSQVHTQGVVVR
ncbi:hypothetical protein AGMMS49938_11370 [Fibrobacterales bacterium]|nr:hypothetical protein AGMMS49938_11370 [Fibrobacterales bacterium]